MRGGKGCAFRICSSIEHSVATVLYVMCNSKQNYLKMSTIRPRRALILAVLVARRRTRVRQLERARRMREREEKEMPL